MDLCGEDCYLLVIFIIIVSSLEISTAQGKEGVLMPDNQGSAASEKEGAELSQAEYNNYVQTLYYSQAQSLRIVQALNNQSPPGPNNGKCLTRFRHRLHIKRNTGNLERKPWHGERRKG